MNPIKQYREFNSLSQSQLAALANCTPQVVLLAEAGVYTTLPPRLKHVTHSSASDYLDFQIETRQQHRQSLEDAALAFDPCSGPFAHHPHTNYRLLVVDSLIGYCKMLAIAPQIVRNYERKLSRPNLHPLVRQYLKDAGLSDALITDLGVRFENTGGL